MKWSALAAALLLAGTVRAEVPRVFSYTGTLTDTNGNPVSDGNHTATFRFFDAVQGGDAIWEHTYQIETVSGVFTALLGTNSPNLEPSLFARDQVWLEIAIEGDTLAPRLRVVAVPYALAARSLDCEGCVTAANVDSTEVQSRIGGTCSGGQAVGAVNEDGTVVCVDAGGSLAAGPGIAIDGATISTSFTGFACGVAQLVCGFDVTGAPQCCPDNTGGMLFDWTCDGTEKVVGWDVNGFPICEPDEVGAGGGTVTQINTLLGSGLTGGPITGSGNLSIAPNGVQTSMIATRAVSQELGTADIEMACTGGTLTAELACQVGNSPVALFSRTLTDPGLYLFFVHLDTVSHDLIGGDSLALQLVNVSLASTVDPDDLFDTWDYRFYDATNWRSISRVFMYEKVSSAATPEDVEINAFTDDGIATIGGYDTPGWAGHGAGMRVIHLKR